MTALYLPGDGHGYCCHVGDSRLYLFRNDKLEQLTHDHTLVADLKEQGKITDEEAFVHPQRNILLQALGVEETVNADFFSFRLQEGDRLLLCSTVCPTCCVQLKSAGYRLCRSGAGCGQAAGAELGQRRTR